MLTPDFEIAERGIIIEGFEPAQRRPGVISFGVTSYGYDARLANVLDITRNYFPVVANDGSGHVEQTTPFIDPKNFDEHLFERVEVANGDAFHLPPHSLALGRTVERFKIPRDTLAVCVGKSTYARCGIIVNVTPLEPEWEGLVTVEISNTTPFIAKVYAGEGIMQVLFLKAQNLTCKTSYADKQGIYQGQDDITYPRVA